MNYTLTGLIKTKADSYIAELAAGYCSQELELWILIKIQWSTLVKKYQSNMNRKVLIRVWSKDIVECAAKRKTPLNGLVTLWDIYVVRRFGNFWTCSMGKLSLLIYTCRLYMLRESSRGSMQVVGGLRSDFYAS